MILEYPNVLSGALYISLHIHETQQGSRGD